MLPSVLYASSVVGSNFSSPKYSNSAHDGLRGDGPIALRGVDAARRGEARRRQEAVMVFDRCPSHSCLHRPNPYPPVSWPLSSRLRFGNSTSDLSLHLLSRQGSYCDLSATTSSTPKHQHQETNTSLPRACSRVTCDATLRDRSVVLLRSIPHTNSLTLQP